MHIIACPWARRLQWPVTLKPQGCAQWEFSLTSSTHAMRAGVQTEKLPLPSLWPWAPLQWERDSSFLLGHDPQAKASSTAMANCRAGEGSGNSHQAVYTGRPETNDGWPRSLSVLDKQQHHERITMGTGPPTSVLCCPSGSVFSSQNLSTILHSKAMAK